MLRRVALNSKKLDLKDIGRSGLSAVALAAMGRDLGSIYAAHRLAAGVALDLARLPPE